MSMCNQEILGILESHDRNRELSALIQCHQEKIKYIMEKESLSKPKDLITIARDFKELVKLDENELKTKYNVLKIEELKVQYPDFKFKLQEGDIHAELWFYKGKALPEFPSGIVYLMIKYCENLEALPEFPPGLECLEIDNCTKLKLLPEFPPGLGLVIGGCKNLELLPEFPQSLKFLIFLGGCPNLTQETLDRIEEFENKQS